MAEKTDWEAMAANLLKAELKRKGVTYAQLVEKLNAMGIDEKEANVSEQALSGQIHGGVHVAMSSSRWGAIFALGLISGGIVVIIAMVMIIGLNYCPNGPCYQGAGPNDNPSDYEYWIPFGVGPNTIP